MTDAAFEHVAHRVAQATRRPRRLPPGVGLAIGAMISLALWGALGGLLLLLAG